MTQFNITQPDDLHVHLRDGEMLKSVAPHTARQFGRALVMPNLVPPVLTTEQAIAYRERIIAAAGVKGFEPIPCIYLTDNTSPAEIIEAKQSGLVKAAKLYPAGATTNSDSGVTDIEKIYPVLEEMEKQGILFLLHGEVTAHDVDIFDREEVFIDRVLSKLAGKFSGLRIVFEHITTKDAADFVTSAAKNIAATITPQHLLFNRNHLLVGGVRPHYYCLPILKREDHRVALVKASLSDSGKFFAGTDSAPHLQGKKENACGCAGCFSAVNAVEFYAQSFDDNADLTKSTTQKIFENFMSKFGADFYGLPHNTAKITLKKETQKIAESIDTPEGKIIPLMAGQEINWKVI